MLGKNNIRLPEFAGKFKLMLTFWGSFINFNTKIHVELHIKIVSFPRLSLLKERLHCHCETQ